MPGMMEAMFARENYALARKLLDVAALRQEALAGNLANVETAGYKRVDISPDFASKLKDAAAANDVAAISNMDPWVRTDLATKAVRPDGNNVALDKEMLEMNRNAAEYEFLTQFMSNNIRRLNTAIRGRSA